MTDYETRCEREDEEDRLTLTRPWEAQIRSLVSELALAQKVGARRRNWTAETEENEDGS